VIKYRAVLHFCDYHSTYLAHELQLTQIPQQKTVLRCDVEHCIAESVHSYMAICYIRKDTRLESVHNKVKK